MKYTLWKMECTSFLIHCSQCDETNNKNAFEGAALPKKKGITYIADINSLNEKQINLLTKRMTLSNWY